MRENDAQNGSQPQGLPAWLKIAGAVVAVLILVVVVVLLAGGGEHGPGRHGALGTAAPDAPTLASVLG